MRSVGLGVLLVLLFVVEVWWFMRPGDDDASSGPTLTPRGQSATPPPSAGLAPRGPGSGLDGGLPTRGGPALPAAPDHGEASGHVEDASGRRIEGAGVYLLDGATVSAEVTTDAEGRFTLPLSGEDHGETYRIAAVAPGCLATVLTLESDRRTDLHIGLVSDTRHAPLEIELVQPDGSPASGAHVWVTPVGASFPPFDLTPPADDSLALTRHLRARLERASDLADQEIEVGQGCSGVGALRPDLAGRIRIAALLPGSYRVVAAMHIVAEGRTVPPDETLMISAYCTDGNTISAEACVDAVVDVAPPPATTSRRLALLRARSFAGRTVVERNPAWGADEGHWCHIVEVEGCPWTRAEVESGAWEFAGTTHAFTGRFRLEGVPRSACRIRVRTWGDGWHPDATYDLSAITDSAPIDAVVKDIRIVDGRTLSGTVTWADGSALADPADLRIDGCAAPVPHAAVEIPGPDSKQVGARYVVYLERPLLGSESAVLRIKAEPGCEYRLPLAAYSPGRPDALRQDLVIPAVPSSRPGRGAGAK